MSKNKTFNSDSNYTEVNSSEELYRKIDEYLKTQKNIEPIQNKKIEITNVVCKKMNFFQRIKQYLELGF